MFTSFLEPRSFVCDVTLVEAARRTPDDSADYSIEVKRKNYPGSFSFRQDRVRRRDFNAWRRCSPGKTLVRLQMSYRHRCWGELRLLDANPASFTQIS